MKSPKKWYWIALLAGVLALGAAATRVKGDSNRSELRKFQADGTAALDPSGISATGTIKGSEIGTATITDNGYSGTVLGNTGTGTCALGGGNITITAADGSTLKLVRSGVDCDIAGPGLNGGNIGNHTYIITGGTGRFAGVIGGGNYTFSINNSLVLIHIDGNIQIAGGGGGEEH